jgi:hypothetical protein
MIIFFTDDPQRDEQVCKDLHATRTLQAVCQVRTYAELRNAVQHAIAAHSQIVYVANRSWGMRQLSLLLGLLAIPCKDVHDFFHSTQTTPAAAHAASPTQHAAAAGQTINHHAHPASV